MDRVRRRLTMREPRVFYAALLLPRAASRTTEKAMTLGSLQTTSRYVLS